jgi:hypothetical protein
MTTPQHFGDSQGVLRYIQEKSDDIEKVVIPLYPFGQLFDNGVPTGEFLRDIGLVVHCVQGNQILIDRADAEVILNDGILNRMKIKIEFKSPT